MIQHVLFQLAHSKDMTVFPHFRERTDFMEYFVTKENEYMYFVTKECKTDDKVPWKIQNLDGIAQKR